MESKWLTLITVTMKFEIGVNGDGNDRCVDFFSFIVNNSRCYYTVQSIENFTNIIIGIITF